MKNNLLWLIQRHAQEARDLGFEQSRAMIFEADGPEEREANKEIDKLQRQQSKTWQRIQRLLGVIE